MDRAQFSSGIERAHASTQAVEPKAPRALFEGANTAAHLRASDAAWVHAQPAPAPTSAPTAERAACLTPEVLAGVVIVAMDQGQPLCHAHRLQHGATCAQGMNARA